MNETSSASSMFEQELMHNSFPPFRLACANTVVFDLPETGKTVISGNALRLESAFTSAELAVSRNEVFCCFSAVLNGFQVAAV